MTAPTFLIITQEVFILHHLFQHSHVPKQIRNRTMSEIFWNGLILATMTNMVYYGLSLWWETNETYNEYTWPVTLNFMASFPVFVLWEMYFQPVLYCMYMHMHVLYIIPFTAGMDRDTDQPHIEGGRHQGCHWSGSQEGYQRLELHVHCVTCVSHVCHMTLTQPSPLCRVVWFV